MNGPEVFLLHAQWQNAREKITKWVHSPHKCQFQRQVPQSRSIICICYAMIASKFAHSERLRVERCKTSLIEPLTGVLIVLIKLSVEGFSADV